MWRLTEDEIREASGNPWSTQPCDERIAEAQARKLYLWGEEPCFNHHRNDAMLKIVKHSDCSLCLQQLRKELGLE